MTLEPALSDPIALPALAEFRPEPALRVARTEVAVPGAPVVDAHNHLGRWLSSWVGRDGRWMIEDVGALLAIMDAWRVEAIVNLDGRWGAELEANLDRYDRAHPGRFATFCHVDWSLLAAAGADAATPMAASLRASAAAGARGLKVWKDLGLAVRDDRGALVLPDDPRLAPVWETAGELGLPVLIHTADPVAFWAPLDGRNERIEELAAHPEWWFGHGGVPSYEQLMGSFVALVGAHPQTTFIGAHVCSAAEDLELVASWLAAHPNLHLDISARLGELGRQPRAAAALITRFADRVLFGTDAFPVTAADYALYARALETADEHFAYGVDPDDPTPQGRWRISGLTLEPALLAAVYAGNARRLIAFDG
jgi:predicted TIM-barrel fold metal-dependent hydrolase